MALAQTFKLSTSQVTSMKKRYLKVICIFILGFQWTYAQENLKLMFYNLLEFPSENTIPNRLQYLNVILEDYRPDLFMVCELNSVQGADTILSTLKPINPNYQRAVFTTNTSDDNFGDSNELQQLLYFDGSKFSLESQTIVPTVFRDLNHYKLKLKGIDQTANPIILDVIVCHLKASSGFSNEQYRLEMVQDLEAYLITFAPQSNIVLAGDLNVYGSYEPAFQELISAESNITFIDPANRIGNWHNNINYIDVMTQSTRTQSGLGGAGGGFDDRFDFIMTSEYMETNPELSYIAGSYDVYGNNENTQCYNKPINSNDCSGSDFSFTIRNALYNFSDHLPVTLQLQTNQTLNTNSLTTAQAFGIKGANVVDNQLQLYTNAINSRNNSVEIFNSFGQLVKTLRFKNSLYINLDTSRLANGLYFGVLTDSAKQPLKFIVAH